MWDEYDFGETKINPLASYTYDKSFEIADGMTEKEIIKLTEVSAEMLKALLKQSKYRTEQDFVNNLITELYFQKKR